MTQKIKKIIHIKLTLLVLAILPLAVFTLLTSNSSLIARIRSMAVLSGSMTPHLPVGGMVYVMPQKSYGVGDVISFSNSAGVTVTHRIAKVTSNGFVTKGDANKVTDGETVLQNHIIGKEIFVLPYLGYVMMWLKTPLGFIVAIILPTLIFVGLELWAIKGEIEKNTERRVMERLGGQA